MPNLQLVPTADAYSRNDGLHAACLGAISEPVLALGSDGRALLANPAF